MKHRGKEEAEEGKTLPGINTDRNEETIRRRFTLMNADQERRVKFEAETNYNKRFRLTRRDCIGLRDL